ncbi:MAG: hypothetical protein U1F87_00515 [Kiritimatiellia bacterium]
MRITRYVLLTVLTASRTAWVDAEEPAGGAPATTAPAAAETPAPPAEPAPAGEKAPGSVSAGGFEGGGQALGLIDGMIRLHVEQDRMLLLNPRYSVSDDEDMTAGLRFVQRRVFPSKSFHTIYVSGELRDTPGDNTFATFASGFEHRATDYTARLRGYLSPHDAELVETREATRKTTRADGTTVTTRDTFERYEIPLSGAEAEFGVRAPLPTWAGDMRFFGGWHTSDGPMTEQIDGWLTRVEYRPRKFLALEMVTYFDREFSDSETFFGGRFILPFGPGASGGDAQWYEPLPSSPGADSIFSGSSEVRSKSDQTGSAPPVRRRTTRPSSAPPVAEPEPPSPPTPPAPPPPPPPLVPVINPDSPL